MLKSKILVLLVFISLNSFSQIIREVRKEFYSQEKDRLKNAMILRDFYLDESPDSIFNVGNFLIQEGLKKEDMSLLSYGKLIVSSYYYNHGKFEISRRNLNECISYYERKRDHELLADAQNLMGVSYLLEGKNKEAANYFVKSLKNSEFLDEDNQSYMAQINLVETFFRFEEYEAAEKELQAFIKKVQKQKLNKGLRKAYDLMGKIYFASNRLEEGIRFYKKALNLAYQNGDKLGISFSSNNMAIAYFQMGNEEKTKSYFQKALRLRKDLNNPKTLCESYFNLGEFYFFKEDYKTAISYYDSTQTIASKNNLLQEISDAFQRIGESYSMTKNFEKAFEFSSKFAENQQKILKKTQNDDLELNEIYQDFKENEILFKQSLRERTLEKRIQKEENKSFYLLLTTIFVCVVLILLFWKTRK